MFKWVSQALFVPNIDLFASRLNFQTSVYVSWCPDPGAWAVDAFSFCWREFKPYIFPSFQFVRQNPNEAQDGGSFRCSSHSTLVANSTLVPTASPFICLASYPSASVGRAPNFASGGFSTPSERCNSPSRVARIRDNLQVRGISPRAASYVLKSWRPGTEKQYSAAWKCYCCWCDRKQRNPLQADLEAVCDFLTEQF